jgi:Rhodanese-like domain
MKHFKPFTLFFIITILFILQTGVWAAGATQPMIQKNCLKCHQGFNKMENILAGNLSSKSMKAHTIQVKINNRLELVKFDPDVKVQNIPDIKALKGAPALRVHYKTVGHDRVATEIVVKPKIKVPENQLIEVKELAELVTQGPQKGAYTLVDSRPTGAYMKGHIPTAISVPFPKMEEMADKFPKDKNQLLVFYCQGYR